MPNAISYARALEALAQGGLVVYPTETFYGMGCVATNHEAVARVFAVKNRPNDKPLPVVLGDAAQLHLVAAAVPEDALRLAELFWPGPLSLLLPAAPALPDLVTGPCEDGARRVSVRVTPHPLAARLCRDLGAPLTASSANPSGAAPAATPDAIDSELAARTSGILAERPWPGGGLPSTMVELVAPGALRILRAGAVPVRALADAGFAVSDAD